MSYEKHTDDHRLRKFSGLDGWKLEEHHQDIRSLPLYDKAGVKLGLIEDLLVDLDAERVAAVLLEGGLIVPVEPLEIQDDRVIDHGVDFAHEPTVRTFNPRPVRPV